MATRRLNEHGVLIRIRTRPRPPYTLPRFDGNSELIAESARFDRLELTREYLLSQVQRDYETPYELAIDVGTSHRSAVSDVPLDSLCDAFRSYSDGNGEGGIKINVGSTVGNARWLVELAVEFRSVDRGHSGNADMAARPPVRLKLRLVINPTRLAAHARLRGIVSAGADWRQLLTSDAETFREIADMSVSMTHDNLLPSRFLQPVALDSVIGETVAFLRAIDALMEHMVGAGLRGTRPSVGAWFAESQPWTIRQAETYWEFGHVHAIEYVRRLRPTLWALGNDASERVWTLEDGAETIAFTARLTDSVRLAIYPKTVDRVRFEVRYLKSVPGNNREGVEARLRLIAEDSVRRANRARSAIVERLGYTSDSSAAGSLDALCELVTLLHDYYRDRPDRSGDILRLLLSRGGIRSRGTEFPVSVQEARALSNRGIVRTSPMARHSTTGDLLYTLAPQYQLLFELFSGFLAEGGTVEPSE